MYGGSVHTSGLLILGVKETNTGLYTGPNALMLYIVTDIMVTVVYGAYTYTSTTLARACELHCGKYSG